LAALRLSLLALGVGPGSRVAVPAYSCVALANAPLSLGAEPVPTDIEHGRWTIDPDVVADAGAIVAVHTFGARARLAELRGRAPLVEDCAHAFGLPGIGSGADVAILSFYATKLIGAGEGGAVLTDSSELAGVVRDHRDYTDLPPDGRRLNDKLTELEAALALCQLDRLDGMLEARLRIAHRYDELLAPGRDVLGLPVMDADRVWYRYAVELRGLGVAEAVARLAERGIRADEPVHDWRTGGSAPVADAAYASLLSLPLYPTLRDEEQERVVAAVLEIVAP
jgi:dTDP-4-amino-4,6-dideoxygalactose transaminase